MKFRITVNREWEVDTDDSLDQERLAEALEAVTGREENKSPSVVVMRSAIEQMIANDISDVINLDDISDIDITVQHILP